MAACSQAWNPAAGTHLARVKVSPLSSWLTLSSIIINHQSSLNMVLLKRKCEGKQKCNLRPTSAEFGVSRPFHRIRFIYILGYKTDLLSNFWWSGFWENVVTSKSETTIKVHCGGFRRLWLTYSCKFGHDRTTFNINRPQIINPVPQHCRHSRHMVSRDIYPDS